MSVGLVLWVWVLGVVGVRHEGIWPFGSGEVMLLSEI